MKSVRTVAVTLLLLFTFSSLCCCAEKPAQQTVSELDSEFKTVRKTEIETTGYTTQGVDADGDYIYFIQYNENVVVVYDRDGRRVAVIPVSLTGCKPESIFRIGDTFYVGAAAGGLACCEIALREKIK